jgi:single-strand DNA-binding protein
MATTKQKPKPEEEPGKDPIVTKVGNLTADPELRFGETSHNPYARMRLAVSTPRIPRDWAGERETTYYDVTAFGSLAEHAAKSLRKGMRLIATGRGEVRTWTGNDGTEHKSKGIVADAIGPDLRWATAAVTKVSGRNPSSAETESTHESEDF